METITPSSLRAARAFLSWSTRDLEKASGVARGTISEIEARDDPGVTPRKVRPATVAKIIEAFAAHGVAFLPPPSDGVIRIPKA